MPHMVRVLYPSGEDHAACAALIAGDAPLMPSKSPSKSELRQLWRSSHPTPEVRREASREICNALAKSLQTIDGSIMAFHEWTMNPIWMRC